MINATAPQNVGLDLWGLAGTVFEIGGTIAGVVGSLLPAPKERGAIGAIRDLGTTIWNSTRQLLALGGEIAGLARMLAQSAAPGKGGTGDLVEVPPTPDIPSDATPIGPFMRKYRAVFEILNQYLGDATKWVKYRSAGDIKGYDPTFATDSLLTRYQKWWNSLSPLDRANLQKRLEDDTFLRKYLSSGKDDIKNPVKREEAQFNYLLDLYMKWEIANDFNFFKAQLEREAAQKRKEEELKNMNPHVKALQFILGEINRYTKSPVFIVGSLFVPGGPVMFFRGLSLPRLFGAAAPRVSTGGAASVSWLTRMRRFLYDPRPFKEVA